MTSVLRAFELNHLLSVSDVARVGGVEDQQIHGEVKKFKFILFSPAASGIYL